MYHRIFCLIILSTATLYAQYPSHYPLGGSIDTPTDARSVAMGESFVGMTDPVSGIFYNPASVSFAHGTTVNHTRRGIYHSNGWSYYSASLTIESSIGNFGILYSRRDVLNFPLTSASFYDYTLGITYAGTIKNILSIGVTLKTFDRILVGPVPFSNLETTLRPYMVDLGILYSPHFFTETAFSTKEIHFGLSIINFGNNIYQTTHDSYWNDQYLNNPEINYETPRYLRIGFSSSLTFKGEYVEKLNPFSIIFSGDYRYLFNTPMSLRHQRDQWGIGTETTLYECLSMRAGAFFSSVDGVWGEKGSPAFRYGFGLALPFQRFGMNIPFIVTCDYGAIPLNDFDEYSPVETLSFSLHYTNELF